MAKQEVGLKIDVDVSSVGNVKKELRAAQTELIAMRDRFGETSQEAINAARKVADLRDRIEGAKEAADLFDPGKRFQAFTTAASQLAAGFSAVQGAMALVGSESEDVQKALLKVQGAIALSQGLSELKDVGKSFEQLNIVIQSSTILQKANAAATTLTTGAMRALGISVNTTSTSFKVLRTAIIATGIGALVVALGFAVEALMNLADSSDEAAKAQKKLEKAQKDAAAAIEMQNKMLQDQIDLVDRNTQVAVKRAQAAGKSEEEITRITRDGILKRKKLLEDDLINRGTADAQYFTKLQELRKVNNELEDFDLDQQIKRTQELQRIREEQSKKAEEQRKKDEEKRKELAQKIAEDRAREQREIDELLENERKALAEQEKERQDQIQKELDEADQREFERLQERIEMQRQANAALVQAEIELQDAKFAAASAGLNAIVTLSQGNEKLANTLFAIDRGLAIAKVIIDTQREIGGYFASYAGLGPVGFAAATKFALGAKIRAAASVATIAATTIARFKNSGGGGASAAGGGKINTAAPVAPQLAPQVVATQVNTAAVNQMGNRAARAYVLNSDIQNENQRNAYIERNASIG